MTTSTKGKQELKYIKLDQLQPFPGNPKQHAIEELRASFGRFGAANVIAVVDRKSGLMVAGHGRREALEQMQAANEPAPRCIEVKEDGSWWVPVLYVEFESEDEAAAFLMADNRISALRVNDPIRELAMLQRIESQTHHKLAGTGHTVERMRDLAARINSVMPNTPALGTSAKKQESATCPSCQTTFNLRGE